MPLSRLHSISFLGLDALLVEVEVDVKTAAKPSLILVGLPDTAVKESKDRVLAALAHSHYKIGALQCTVNLAPGHIKKEGPLYDLPIALGILLSQGLLESSIAEDYLCAGELA